MISTEEITTIYTESSKSERVNIVKQRISDEFPFEQVVYHTIETELTHPAGYGTLLNVTELAEMIVSEWVESTVPESETIADEAVSEWFQSVRGPLVKDIVDDISKQVCGRVEEEYVACLSVWAEVESDQSFSSLYEAIEDVEQPTVSEAHSLVTGSV